MASAPVNGTSRPVRVRTGQVAGWQAGATARRPGDGRREYMEPAWRGTPGIRGEVGMAESGSTFVLVATYPDEAAARDDYQVVKDAHAAGLVGSYDAAIVTRDARGQVHERKDETATRPRAWWGLAAGAAVGGIFPPSGLAAAAGGGVLGGGGGPLGGGVSRAQAKGLGDGIGPGQAG